MLLFVLLLFISNECSFGWQLGTGFLKGKRHLVKRNGARYDLSEVERCLATERDACGTGFVAETKSEGTRRVMELALRACECVEHRGACGADGRSGDGAGILTEIPFLLYAADTPGLARALETRGKDHLGCLMLFLPPEESRATIARKVIEECAEGAGFQVVAWRQTPVNPEVLGPTAKESMPKIEQVFVMRADIGSVAQKDKPWRGRVLERALYLLRRSIRGAWIRAVGSIKNEDDCYVASCSSKSVVYKAMCQSKTLRQFYQDLDDTRFQARFCIYHRRFSTNTLPRWSLAQPFRLLAHNGEINTIRGNVNWMAARAKAAGDDLGLIAAGCRTGSPDDDVAAEACALVDSFALGPVVDAGKSDSANLDATCELYTRAGRSIVETTCILMPPANAVGSFYELHAPLSETWDGPAGVVFSDGKVVGARLDRNGLRPARYSLYEDGLVCLSSETGSVADSVLLEKRQSTTEDSWLPPDSNIVHKGRLGPGESVVVDLHRKTKAGGFYDDDEVQSRLAKKPKWTAALKTHKRSYLELSTEPESYIKSELDTRVALQARFGWGSEDVEIQVKNLITGYEPTFAMGDDAPLAVLSAYPHPLYSYLKQRHAQVTNPPIDPIREGNVMSLRTFVGERENCVDVSLDSPRDPESSRTRVIEIDSPVLTQTDLENLNRALDGVTLDVSYDSTSLSLAEALKCLVEDAIQAVSINEAKFITLSDRNTFNKEDLNNVLYIPPLLAVGAVHHALIENGLRLQASIAVETGQCWSTHHVACLVGYGASAVHPWLLFQEAAALGEKQKESEPRLAIANTRKALDAGLLKILSKMGISELASYHAAQIFEAIGLGNEVIEVALKGTASRIGGLSLADIERETKSFVESKAAVGAVATKAAKLENFGFANSLPKAEVHGNSPQVARLLQAAVLEDDEDIRHSKYREFVDRLNQNRPLALRDLLEFREDAKVSLKKKPDLEAVLRRFVTGGMSLGALSREAHETLAIAMNRIGSASNSGEGGEDPIRSLPITTATRESNWSHLRGDSITEGDIARSKIRQVASGRFGVSTKYLATAEQIEIKIAQGAKPGEGGQLPGGKVDEYIASIRLTVPGVTLISPPPHHDIYSIEDLAQLIFDLKAVNPFARVSVKLVSIVGVGTVACGVAKAGADVIQISGHDGGTGAAPLSSIKHAGAPNELGVAEAHSQLVSNGLRNRVIIRTDGGVRTGMDVVKLALLGAEEFGFGTSAMIAAGCIMARVCHTNKCPAGIATQKSELRARARGEPEDVVRYMRLVAHEITEILADLGLPSLAAAVGRTDLLKQLPSSSNIPEKATTIDLSVLLKPAEFVAPESPPPVRPLLNPDGRHSDDKLVARLFSSVEDQSSIKYADESPRRVSNDLDRALGTRLAGALARHSGFSSLDRDDDIRLKFTGSAGQSFGAFTCKGMVLELDGDANDYVGKGLAGARLVIRPPPVTNEQFVAAESVILGNTALYGATSGELFANGGAGDRFAVRNSGARCVVENAGDNLCEYMTAGIVVVIGRVGINVGAGMTGGVAYILGNDKLEIDARLNRDVISRRIADPASPAASDLYNLLVEHHHTTKSLQAESLLRDWPSSLGRFLQILPKADEANPKIAVIKSEQQVPVLKSS